MSKAVQNISYWQHWRWKGAQYFELKWWQHYLNGKDKEAYYSWKRDYWKSVLQQLDTPLAIDKQSRLLDAGCGPAGIFTLFSNLPVTAIDPLLYQYERQLSHFNPADYPNTRFLDTTLEKLSLSNSFSHIFCMNALNHVADIQRSLKNLVKHLDKEGKLILSIDTHNYHILKKLFQYIPGDILHPHQYTLSEYKSIFSKQQLNIEEVKRIRSGYLFDHWVMVLAPFKLA